MAYYDEWCGEWIAELRREYEEHKEERDARLEAIRQQVAATRRNLPPVIFATPRMHIALEGAGFYDLYYDDD